jgi:hypothetical protein
MTKNELHLNGQFDAFITRLFVPVTYHCQGSKGLEIKTIGTLVLDVETSECKIQFKVS